MGFRHIARAQQQIIADQRRRDDGDDGRIRRDRGDAGADRFIEVSTHIANPIVRAGFYSEVRWQLPKIGHVFFKLPESQFPVTSYQWPVKEGI